MTINTLIAELRAGLEGTTPGEWTRRDTPDYAEMIAPDQKQPLALVGRAEDADYIALASPQNIRALLDHIERLKYDLDLAKEQSLLNYNDATGLAMKLGTAEAELARLRKPVTEGEVKGVVRSLSLIACAPRCEHASECNCTVLDNAADLIQRLAGQVAEARERTEREVSATRADAWAERTARIAAEARLREAVEVMEPFAKAGAIKLCGEWKDHEYIGGTDVGFYLNFGDIRRARDFLAKLENPNAE